MKGFKSTSANPYTYTQSGVWKKGEYTFQAIVKSNSGYAIAFQKPDLSWDVIDLSWQVQAGQYCSVLESGFELGYDAVAFRLIANNVTGEVIVLLPMLEQGGNPSTPIAHEEDLRGMDGDFHEFIFTRNDTGIAPPTPLSIQENDHTPIDDSVEPPVIWTDNPQGVTKELPFEFVSMREKKVGVWLDFSPPSLWAKWAEDGFNVKLHLQGHYVSHWEGTAKVTEIVGGEIVNGSEVVKITAKMRKGEKDVTADELLSRGFIWYVNDVEVARDVPSITLDETYGDGFADYVVLSYLVNSLREEEQVEVLNISSGMDGIGEESIFKANNSEVLPPLSPEVTDTDFQNDDYYGQGTENEWNDNPVAPTETNQFVWVAKRKKVGGIWEAFGTPSVWTRWVRDGKDAAYWELHSSAPLIYKDAEDAPTSGGHTTITLSGRYVQGTTFQNGGYISAQPIGGVEDTPSPNPREFTPPNNAGVDEYIFRLYDVVSKTTLLDTLTVPIAFKGEKGLSAINITLSNESDALPATENGVVTDYNGSGTTIRVFEGSQELSYGTGNGQYQVSASGSNILPSSTPTTNGNARVYGNASSMGTAKTAVITFTVSGKTFGGESFSFEKVQNFTKSERGDTGASAPLLYLSASAQVMKCNPDNTPQAGQIISFEAKLQNVSGTATFVATPYNDSGTALTAATLGGTGNTRNIINEHWLATYKRVEVVATLGSLTDKVTIHRLADGATGKDSIVGFLTNENITLQASNAGVVSSFTSASGEFWVYNGTTKVTSGVTFSKVSQTGCTATITSAGVYSVSAMSADNATVVLRAVYGGVTIDKVLTLSKSKTGGDGEDGITIIPNQQGHTYRADLNGGIIGSLADGMVELTITSGSTPITCPSATSGGTPTTNGTYRVTRTLGNGITTNQSVSGGKYRITPATLTVDEASVGLEIKIMMGGVIASYPLTLTYQKQFDGADGKSTEFIFKGSTSDTTAPTLPSTSQQDDWYGQGTSYVWNDDLVEPTKALPYVWASQRKKVDGVWGAFTPPKVWLRYSDGITSTTIHYAKSESGTTVPTSGWGTSIPSPTQGWYLWTRTTTTYKVATTTVSYSVSHWAEDGDGIVSTTIHYQKSSSGTSIPTSWLTSIPSPTKGQYLWTRTTTVYKTSPTTVAYTTSYWAKDGDKGNTGDKGEDAKVITLSATSSQILIAQSGTKTPSSITVRGQAQGVTITQWQYSTNGGSSWSTTAPTGVSRSNYIVTINASQVTFSTLSIRASNVASDIETVETITVIGYGEAGKSGKTPITKEWIQGDTHLNNDNVVDYLYYRPTKTWWKLKDQYASRTATASPSTTYYESVTWLNALALNVLIAEEANIANFVFKDGVLKSLSGRLSNGTPAQYSGQSGFVHNIELDGLTGAVIARYGNFTGTVNATSGKFTGEVNATSGKIGGFDISGNELINAATDARISFNGLDGAQSFIRLNTSSSMIAIRTDVSNKTGLNISTYASGAVGLSIISNSGSALAISSVGGHYFYQRSGEVWSSPGILAAVELRHPARSVYQYWAVSGVSASNSAFTNNGNVVTWTHNLGHQDYVLLASSHASNGGVVVGTKYSNTVTFTVSRHDANENVHLFLIGRNKYVSL